jgi:hypothetical protein
MDKVMERHAGKITGALSCFDRVFFRGYLPFHKVKYTKVDNAFAHLGDVKRAQELADGFERVDWIHLLDRSPCRSTLCSGKRKCLIPCGTTGSQPKRSTQQTSCLANEGISMS